MDSKAHVPAETKWEFDASVTECFEDMLRRSIPQYDVMREAVRRIGEWYIRNDQLSGVDVVDLGCSRGAALEPFVYKGRRCIGVEVSEPMVAASRFRYEQEIEDGVVDIVNMDLRIDYPKVATQVTLAVLLLQFVPIEYRQQIVYQAYKNTVPGGAFIVVEKILGGTHELDQLMVATYLEAKAQNGYSQESIDRKRLSLEGVLVPVTAEMNEMFLRRAGFAQVDCFWRWMNFAGWVAVKE